MRDLSRAAVIVNSADIGRHPVISNLREICKCRGLIAELVRRDLKVRYKNSIGGVLWSLINPLLQIAVITLLLKFIQTNPVKNYSAHLFVMFLWNFYLVALSDGCACILSNATLVRKIYFPRAILPLVTLIGNVLHFGVAFAFTILYFFVLGAYPSELHLWFLMVIPVVLCTMTMCLGISYILSYLNVFYEDVRFIVTAMLGVFFYALPILYPIENVFAYPVRYQLYMLNPVATLLVCYQRALLAPPEVIGKSGLPLAHPAYPWLYLGLAGVESVALLIVGFVLFEKYQWEIAERL